MQPLADSRSSVRAVEREQMIWARLKFPSPETMATSQVGAGNRASPRLRPLQAQHPHHVRHPPRAWPTREPAGHPRSRPVSWSFNPIRCQGRTGTGTGRHSGGGARVTDRLHMWVSPRLRPRRRGRRRLWPRHFNSSCQQPNIMNTHGPVTPQALHEPLLQARRHESSLESYH